MYELSGSRIESMFTIKPGSSLRRPTARLHRSHHLARRDELEVKVDEGDVAECRGIGRGMRRFDIRNFKKTNGF